MYSSRSRRDTPKKKRSVKLRDLHIGKDFRLEILSPSMYKRWDPRLREDSELGRKKACRGEIEK